MAASILAFTITSRGTSRKFQTPASSRTCPFGMGWHCSKGGWCHATPLDIRAAYDVNTSLEGGDADEDGPFEYPAPAGPQGEAGRDAEAGHNLQRLHSGAVGAGTKNQQVS